MSFRNRYPGDRVGKSECPTVGREIEAARDAEAIVAQRPRGIESFEQIPALRLGQRRNAAFAGFAVAGGKFVGHGNYLLS